MLWIVTTIYGRGLKKKVNTICVAMLNLEKVFVKVMREKLHTNVMYRQIGRFKSERESEEWRESGGRKGE